MKKFVLSFIILLFYSAIIYSQNSSFDEIFDKYALKDGFTTVNISGDLFNMLTSSEEKKEEIKIGNIKILTVEDPKLNAQLNFYEDIVPKLSLDDYNKLINIKNEDEQVIIMKKKKSKGKQEFLLITGGNDNTMIYIEGNLNFSELNEVAKVINSETLSFMTDSE